MKPDMKHNLRDAAVSICVIVKNEEANLPGLLDSIAALDAELVIVDTGSTDASVLIAGASGATVVNWPWRNDFAAARNVSIDHATRPWILWMDADDRLPHASLDPLRTLAKQSPTKAYSFVIKNTNDGGATGTEFTQARMFPNKPKLRFTGSIHEQILPALHAAGIPVEHRALVIHHTGYTNMQTIQEKQRRNRDILREIVRLPDAGSLQWYQLGMACADLNDLAEAEACFRTALDFVDRGTENKHLRSILPALIASLKIKQGDHAGAHAVFLELLDADPATWHPNQIAIAGEVWLHAVSPQAATQWFDRAYTPPQPESLLPLDPKKTAFMPLRHLADYWRATGHQALAVDFLRILKSVMDGNYPPRRVVADTYLRHGMAPRAAELYAWCIDVDGEDPGLWAATARATAMAGDPQTAAQFLEAGLGKWPAHPELVGLAQGTV